MAGNEVRIRASIDDKTTGPLNRIKDKFDLLGKSGGFKALVQGVGLGVGAAATTMALNAVGAALSGVIESALEEERSIAKLDASLRANVKSWGGNTKAIEETLAARMKLGFADDEQRDSLALLVAATHDATKALSLQRTAMDLARLKGISLKEASEALIRVEGGQYRALKSLGIVLRDGATQTEALAAVQKLAAGQAAEFAATSGGKLLAAQVKLDDKLEELGTMTLPLVADAAGLVSDSLDALTAASESAHDAIFGTGDKINHVMQKAGMAAKETVATVGAAAKDLANELPEALDEAKKEAKRIARKTPGEIADALRSRRDEWQSALDDLQTDTENSLSRTAEIAKLKALLAGDEIANGLKSKDPVVRAAAAALQQTATDRLNELQGRASHAGNAAARDLARALKNKKLDVRQAAELLELQVKNALGQLPSSAYGWGKSTSREYAEGLRANIPKVESAAKAVARSASDYLRIQSPAKKGPLSEGGPEVWGAKFGASWAKGLDGSKGAIERASAGLASGVRPRGVGPLGMTAEGAGGGIAFHFHGMAYPPSPAQQREMAQNMGPALREYLDRRG